MKDLLNKVNLRFNLLFTNLLLQLLFILKMIRSLFIIFNILREIFLGTKYDKKLRFITLLF